MPITVNGSYLPSTSGSIIAYKYEDFGQGNTLGPNGSNTLTISGSSLVAGYFSGSGSTVLTFAGSFKSVGSSSGETVTILSSDGSSLTYTFFIYGGRFSGNTTVSLYVSEAVSNKYSPSTSVTTAFATPTPPSGLSFGVKGTDIVLYGTPSTVSPLTNYLFYGSNSSTGYTVSSTVSIQVNAARVAFTNYPSTQLLTVGVVFTGVTLTSINSNALTFSGIPPAGLTATCNATSTSMTISGTPGIPSNADANGLTSSRYTVYDLVTGAFAIVTIPFKYSETVQFTYPASNIEVVNLYTGIALANTANVPSLTLIAVTNYGIGSNITYSSVNPLPTGLVLTTVTIPATTSPAAPAYRAGVISGTPTGSGTQICSFLATNSTPTSGTSSTITFTVSQATFNYTTPTLPALYVGQKMTSVSFSITIPAYLDNGVSEISSIYTAPDGILVTSNATTFTISGTPRTLGSGSIILNVSASNVTPATLTIPVTVNADTVTFTATPLPPYAFAQNIAITPIQISASFLYGAAATLYYNVSLPAGLSISGDGLIRGTPTSASLGSTFLIGATNGYTSSNNSYSYTTAVDSLICYTSSSLPTLYNGTSISAPVTTVLRSGNVVTSLTSGYLYGLTLTPTRVSGYFESGVYPSVVLLPGKTVIKVLGSGTSPPSTIIELTASGTQTRTKVFSSGSNICYTTSDVFAMYNVATGGSLTSNITDLQPATPGLSTYMAANNTINTYYTVNGTSYTSNSSPANIYSVTYANSIWYGLGSTGLYSNVGTSWSNMSINGPTPTNDGRLVLRSVPMSNSLPLNATSASVVGSTIQYTLSSNVPSSGTAVWTFSGFNYAGYNLEQVQGTVSGGGYVVTVNSTAPVSTPAENFGFTNRPAASYYVPTTSRLLLGGKTLTYVNSGNKSATLSSCTLTEVRDICSSVYGLIVAAGGYPIAFAPSSAVSTLQYSTDGGITWGTSTNDFTWYASSVVWGGYISSLLGLQRAWIAIGYDITGIPGIKYSIDGKTWVNVDIGATITSSTVIGPVQFDGTNWQIFVNNTIYLHDANPSTLASSTWWTSAATTTSVGLYPTPYFNGSFSSASLVIGTTSGGPVFTSPTVTNYIGYQYIIIDPIVFDTVDSGTSFFLASTLPPGLAWSPVVTNVNGHVCATITGQPVILGTTIIDVYAQNATGVSKLTVTIITQQLPFKTPDTTPSGYINFIKQKVIADSAVSSINNRALVSPVGTFLAKDPQPEITAPAICCLTPSTQ